MKMQMDGHEEVYNILDLSVICKTCCHRKESCEIGAM